MTRTMRTYLAGGDAALRAADRDVPAPGEDEVLVRVRAVALNNGDLAPGGDAHVPCFEFSGEVVEIGAGVADDLLHARVLGITEGALAEYAVAHRRHVLPLPELLTDAQAASLPTALTTEIGAARQGGLRPGATVLITGATSSIGLLGIQVVRELGASRVIATSRSEQKRGVLERVGADTVLVTGNDGIAEQVLGATGGRGADLVLDHIGGDALDQAVAAARDGGDVISVGRLGGGTAAVDLFALARRHVLLRSVSYGLRPPAVLGALFDEVGTHLIPAITAGRIVPVVDEVFPFDDAPDAFERLRSGSAEGKVVVAVR